MLDGVPKYGGSDLFLEVERATEPPVAEAKERQEDEFRLTLPGRQSRKIRPGAAAPEDGVWQVDERGNRLLCHERIEGGRCKRVKSLI